MSEQRSKAVSLPLTSVETLRFWQKVIHKPNACWEWIGATSKKGYGRVVIRGKSFAPHAVSWSNSERTITDA